MSFVSILFSCLLFVGQEAHFINIYERPEVRSFGGRFFEGQKFHAACFLLASYWLKLRVYWRAGLKLKLKIWIYKDSNNLDEISYLIIFYILFSLED